VWRYEQLLRRLVAPVPVGLRIAPLRDPDHRGQGLLLIEVPAQSPDVRPFAVGGAHVGASVHGAMIGVPVRRGADTDWMKIEALQALLRAGRAAVGIRT
jgi:hypothetical protein